jgi:hypothetical protein
MAAAVPFRAVDEWLMQQPTTAAAHENRELSDPGERCAKEDGPVATRGGSISGGSGLRPLG